MWEKSTGLEAGAKLLTQFSGPVIMQVHIQLSNNLQISVFSLNFFAGQKFLLVLFENKSL